MRNLLITITRHPLSLAGAALASASALLIITFFAIGLVGFEGGPYQGILIFVILPAIFVCGLILIPIGVVRHRRLRARAAARGEEVAAFPVLDFNRERTRKLALSAFLLTALNLVILATATYKGVEVMESEEFCGSACHVMEPERVAHKRFAHASVACVKCHVGPGAASFAEAKLAGTKRLFGVAFNSYPTPIPTPVLEIRPAYEICTECHTPARFLGEKLKVITKYQDDEASTELKTVVNLQLGGIEAGVAHGIHWHADPSTHVRFRSDPSRQIIGDVEVTSADGSVRLFKAPEGSEAAKIETEWRTMDCMDCHNRPAHTFRTPEREVNLALRQGQLDRSLPFLARESVRLLKANYADRSDAERKIGAELATFYGQNDAERAASDTAKVKAASTTLAALWAANVFPHMKVDWRTYPVNLGHEDYPGCFRCHDEEHATADGRTISQDCALCHALPAVDEEAPEILEALKP